MQLKQLIFTLLVFSSLQVSYGQKNKKQEIIPRDWFLLDAKKDKVQGMSVDRAYKTLLKKKESKTVIVAVIDSGIDIEHEDLQGKIWVNEGEIAGNGIDDDNNGYVDDINGWSFLGSDQGDVNYETYEYLRIYKSLKAKYDTISTVDSTSAEFDLYNEVKYKYLSERKLVDENYNYAQLLSRNYNYFEQLLKKELDTSDISIDDLEKLEPSDSTLFMAKNFLLITYDNYGEIKNFFEEAADYFKDQIKNLDIDADYRSIVGDDPDNLTEKYYGNNNVQGPDADHGTHVAGIIGANRNNKLGNRGVADNVRIMPLRAVPNGDERDKDVANAIRYAADNGAQIINMSFGKSYSPQKEQVDEAVAYAESKGVLLIHAAGNDGNNIDSVNNFPNRRFLDGGEAKTWIEVGASAAKLDTTFASDFSNYGKDVNLFAPGVDIYSTIPNNEYEANDGTSMAAPMVTGVAALLMSYFPELTAEEVKEILLNSIVKLDSHIVNIPGTNDKSSFGELSSTGGLINAVQAVQLAIEMTEK